MGGGRPYVVSFVAQRGRETLCGILSAGAEPLTRG